ncbi:MAG: glycosyltransferase, partial [bacterium]|nr:glycosyltransferase [bacterium]
MLVARGARNAVTRTRVKWQRDRNGSNLEPEQGPQRDSPTTSAGVSYRDWFCRLPADPSILAVQRQWFEEWPRPPRVWGLVVDDGGDVAASEASLRNQSWGRVEAVKVAPSGLSEEFHRLSQDCPSDLAVLLRAGDRLRPDAVYQIAQAAWRDPWIELVYWDDDLDALAQVWEWHQEGMPHGVFFDGDLDRLSRPRLKPGWSPDLLLCANYIGRAFAVRARNLQPDAARRYRSAGTGDDSLWWDLLLGLELRDEQVIRLPAVLQTLSGRDHRIEPHHLELVDRKLSRQGWPARAEAGESGVNLVWAPDREAPVTVIIATRHDRELLEGAFEVVRSAGYPSLELIIVDNGGQSSDNEAWYQREAGDLSPRVIWWDEPFNYSEVNNRAAEQATGEVLVFLNDDTSPGHPRWLHSLVGWAQRPEIGVAGLQLIDDRGLIQFGGVVIGMTGLAGHLFQGMAPHSDTLLGPT